MKNEDNMEQIQNVEIVEDDLQSINNVGNKDNLPSVVGDNTDGLSSIKSTTDVFALKKKLLASYYDGYDSLIEKMQENAEGLNVETMITVVMEELLGETDNLKSNELVFTQDGKLHDASSIAVKRSEILDTVSKVMIRKKEMMSKAGDIDLDSPAFQLFQSICFDALTESFMTLNFDDEMKQVIISKWGENMADWKEELSSRLKRLKKDG